MANAIKNAFQLAHTHAHAHKSVQHNCDNALRNVLGLSNFRAFVGGGSAHGFGTVYAPRVCGSSARASQTHSRTGPARIGVCVRSHTIRLTFPTDSERQVRANVRAHRFLAEQHKPQHNRSIFWITRLCDCRVCVCVCARASV